MWDGALRSVVFEPQSQALAVSCGSRESRQHDRTFPSFGPSLNALHVLRSLVLSFLLVGLLGLRAPAHERLVRSSPAAGDSLAAAPSELRLIFSSRVQLAFSGLELLDADGRAIPLGALRSPADSATVLVADVMRALAPGRYTVAWRTGGADGHPVRGRYEFVVLGAVPVRSDSASRDSTGASASAGHADHENHAADAADAIAPTGESDTSTDAPLQAAVRWLAFATIVGVVGVAVFQRLVLPAAAVAGSPELVAGADRNARVVGSLLASLLLVAVVARLVAQWAALGGPDADAQIGRVLTTTEWGWGWMLQLSGAAAALASLVAGGRSRLARGLLIAGVVALCVSPALSGHAAATGALAPLTIAADALHVLGAGAWVGTLFVLVVAGIPAALALPAGGRGPAAALLVHRFSPIALVAASLLVASGVASAWVHLGSLDALLGTAYGRTLLVKLALVALVAALGAFHWRRARPALGTEDAARGLRRTAAVELAIAAVVLAVTAVLVATPPPGDGP